MEQGRRWQKLLMPWLADAIPAQGYAGVGGPIVEASAVEHITRPREIVSAFGFAGDDRFDDDPDHVDVMRFELAPLMFTTAPSAQPRPWPTYPAGTLPEVSDASVRILERTRVPTGAELWRVSRDGELVCLSIFDGPAQGWRLAPGFFPPTHLVGPRAEWDGGEYAAAFAASDPGRIELVVMGDHAPAGFTQGRPGLWSRLVPVSECTRVFDVSLTCMWRGLRCRVLQRSGDVALLLLLDDDPAEAERVGAAEVEPGVYEAHAMAQDVSEISGVTREY